MAGARVQVDEFDLREYEDLLFSDVESAASEEDEEVAAKQSSRVARKDLNKCEGSGPSTSACSPIKQQQNSGSLVASEDSRRRTTVASPASRRNLDIKPSKTPPRPTISTWSASIYMARQKQLQRGLPSLVNLCVGVLGQHLEEIVDCADVFVHLLPTPVRLALAAIARRRGLLCDSLLMALAEDSWEVVDVSRSSVTDKGVDFVARSCPRLKAVDISHCRKLTSKSVESLVEHCPHLQTLRCGGDAVSDGVVREAMGCLLPQLTAVTNTEALDWEDLDDAKVGIGAQSLVYLVWPTIDACSSDLIRQECPKIVLAGRSPECAPPSSSSATLVSRERGLPLEAHAAIALDERFVENIDPSCWAERVETGDEGEEEAGRRRDRRGGREDEERELSIAERFRLAYISRDERLAPKRAKNARQMQRRVMRAWLKGDTDAKSRLLASVAERSLLRNLGK